MSFWRHIGETLAKQRTFLPKTELYQLFFLLPGFNLGTLVLYRPPYQAQLNSPPPIEGNSCAGILSVAPIPEVGDPNTVTQAQ